ncbi:winged helix-turn-helix transcriptional regulator [Yinghuangia sp. ASG 101]|uniref:winged helix-turn-helix transcriptional regulator n=1 Tax=Yinghuangia sp. ASG 101 TaxID=2896848 RepID=UPI001E2EDCDC|nr:winged helix-turn-helix transcriptional regulator [Yinghuangia sp. ASG 101]UGQ10951.1 winged helix-turn-helix transcriptional regulator [Yinghuangia sp. ASG 101]
MPENSRTGDVRAPVAAALRAREHALAKHAVSVLAPRWTAWILQALAERGDHGLTRNEFNNGLPFMPNSSATVRLNQLSALGLVTHDIRHRTSHYTISDAGQATLPAQERLAVWARAHYTDARPTPNADATEIALGQIMGKNTLDILAVARTVGTMEVPDLRTVLPNATYVHLTYCVQDMQQRGLLERVERGRYALSNAARDVEPALAALAAWAGTYARTNEPPPGNSQTKNPARVLPTTATTARAVPPEVRKAPAALAVRFSHPPQPFDHTSAAATTRSGRGR